MTDNQMPVFSVSVPGSAMLMGEHAVLHGSPALVCALERRMTVHLSLLDDKVVRIESALGQYETGFDCLCDSAAADPAEFRFVLAVVRGWCRQFSSGVCLTIESDIPHTVGLGSSAAITVATEVVCRLVADQSIERADVLKSAVSTIRAVQGRGSGADVAASVYGGVIEYNADTVCASPVVSQLALALYYVGYKTPTVDVIEQVEQSWTDRPGAVQRLYTMMRDATISAIECLKSDDLKGFSELMAVYQSLMGDLGVEDEAIEYLVDALRDQPAVLGAKISGSGLGDCVVALLSSIELSSHLPIYLSVSAEGVGREMNFERVDVALAQEGFKVLAS